MPAGEAEWRLGRLAPRPSSTERSVPRLTAGDCGGFQLPDIPGIAATPTWNVDSSRCHCALRGRLAQPRSFRRLLEQSAELACGHWLMIAAAGKQPALFRRNAGVMPGRPRLPPLPQQVEDLGRQHHVSVLAAFRLHDADDHLLTVDVARP